MASAILPALDPEKYTVIDFRALEALGVADADANLEFYIRYYLRNANAWPRGWRLAEDSGSRPVGVVKEEGKD